MTPKTISGTPPARPVLFVAVPAEPTALDGALAGGLTAYVKSPRHRSFPVRRAAVLPPVIVPKLV